MEYSLAEMFAQRKPRKRTVTFRPVTLPATMASDLYATAYAPVVKEWEQGIAAIIAEYERSLNQLTTDAAPELSGVIVSIENGISQLTVSLRLRLERWAARIESAHRRRWNATVKQSTGLDVSTLTGPADMRVPLTTVIERNVELVRSVSDQTRARISDIVFRGLSEKKPVRAVAAEIREGVGMGRARALRIASDQSSKASATLNTSRAQEAGLEFYEWVSSGKIHFRPEHAARKGKRYKYGHFGSDEPGLAIYCGCTARAVLSLDSEF